ncbi:ATP-binding cassette domain-containing protein [Streptomyces synnematoformans]|uniref:ATP-binding cassette domain-containing protein n=1 Tax=Streptomyces synnematoformans TaxID=415721 RepID=A0ABN2X919_9ACTN
MAGRDPFTPAGRRALRGRVTAFLPQDPASALDPRRTVSAQLRTAARISRPGDTRRQRALLLGDAAAAAALAPGLLRRHPARLSGGQAQRALLAWTYLTRPRLLILDEPTSGLDAETARRVSTTFTSLPWRPAVLLISHDRALVDRVADRVLELGGGRLRTAAPAPAPPPVHRSAPALGGGQAAVLATDRLTIRRGGRSLLREASLRLGPGELVAVQGPSGSGKTALARTLCGLATPQSGHLRVHGVQLSWDAAGRARTGGPFLAYVGQDARAALHPHETVEATLTRALAAARRHGRATAATVPDLLDRFSLPAAVRDRTPQLLSGGQRHRVALARALAAAPAVLVCDETTASLDRASTGLVLDALDRLRHDAGVPVLLITHQDAVAARADRILTLAEGRLQ